MELYVYSPALELRGFVQGVSSCLVTLRYAGAGDITVECANTAENQTLLANGCYLALRQDRYLPAGQAQTLRKRFDAFMIESIQWEAEEDGELLRLRGVGLSGLLRLRMIENVTSVNGNSVAAIQQLVQNNCIQPALSARAFPFWKAEAGSGGVSCQKQVAHESLYDTVCALAAAGGTGFAVDLLPAERTMLFYQYTGADRSAGNRFGSFLLLDDRFGNLVSSSYLCDGSESRTTALVLGEEQEDGTRKTVVVGGERKGLDRRELVVDAGDLHSSYTENGSQVTLTEAQYRAQLTTRGQERLRDYPVLERLGGEVPPNAGLIFRQDYNLGDLVTVQNRSYGVRSALRITAVQETFDQSGNRVVPVLGDETPALVERMARRMASGSVRDLR